MKSIPRSAEPYNPVSRGEVLRATVGKWVGETTGRCAIVGFVLEATRVAELGGAHYAQQESALAVIFAGAYLGARYFAVEKEEDLKELRARAELHKEILAEIAMTEQDAVAA